MENELEMLDVIIGNCKTGLTMHVRYHLDCIDIDEMIIDQHPGTVPEYPKLPSTITYEDLNRFHTDPSAPHRIYIPVLLEELWLAEMTNKATTVPEAISAMQDEIQHIMENEIRKAEMILRRLKKQKEKGVVVSDGPLRSNED